MRFLQAATSTPDNILLWKRNCNSGSLTCMFMGSRLHRSMYLPPTIWKTRNRNRENAGSNNKQLISHDRSRSWRHARHSHVTVSEMAANAGAVKVGTNDGTITEEVETGLPADGWATFAVGVEIMDPPIAPRHRQRWSFGLLGHHSSLHRLSDQGHDLLGQRNGRRQASLRRSDGFANIGRLGHRSGHRSRRLVNQRLGAINGQMQAHDKSKTYP